MTANIAGTGVPNHWMFWSISPTLSSIQFTTLNCEWNIHFQANVLSAIGIVQGSTNSVRRIFRPGNAPSSIKASATLRVILAAVATEPMISVLRIANLNVGSFQASTKFLSPMKRPSRATVTSVRLYQMPSTSGNPSNART